MRILWSILLLPCLAIAQVTNPPGGVTGNLGGSGTPGGTNGQIQYNNNGALGGYTTIPLANILTCSTTQIVFDSAGSLVCSSQLTWTDSTSVLTLSSSSAGVVTIQTPNATSGATSPLFIKTGNAAVTNSNAGNFNFIGGFGNGTGNGGGFIETAGGGGPNGSGGNVVVTTGNAGASGNGVGGSWTVNVGVSNGSGIGASATINAGAGGATAAGGPINLVSGGGGIGGSGTLSISGGTGTNTAISSNTTLQSGQGVDAAHTGSVILQDFNGDNSLAVDAFGNIICACASSTTATDQFLYLGISSGVPTGVPAHLTGIYSNSVPVRYDTTDNRLYVYNSGWQNPANSAQSEHTIDFQPGLVTSVTNGKAAFTKFVKNSTVDNIVVSAQQFTCTGNPTVTLFECATSTTCATPTTIGSATITAANTAVVGTISSSVITSGDFIAWSISAGTCTLLDIAATAQVHSN